MSKKDIILEHAQKVNEEYECKPVNAILAIWCNHKGLPFSTFDQLVQPRREREFSAEEDEIRETGKERNTKTCQHLFHKGQKANTQSKVKVKGVLLVIVVSVVSVCSKHRKKDVD